VGILENNMFFFTSVKRYIKAFILPNKRLFLRCFEAVLVRDRGAAHSADLGTSSKESY